MGCLIHLHCLATDSNLGLYFCWCVDLPIHLSCWKWTDWLYCAKSIIRGHILYAHVDLKPYTELTQQVADVGVSFVLMHVVHKTLAEIILSCALDKDTVWMPVSVFLKSSCVTTVLFVAVMRCGWRCNMYQNHHLVYTYVGIVRYCQYCIHLFRYLLAWRCKINDGMRLREKR